MKKFVYLFGVLLLITVPQYNFAGDNSEDNDIYNYEFHGRDHDTKDHKEFYHSPIKIRADFRCKLLKKYKCIMM